MKLVFLCALTIIVLVVCCQCKHVSTTESDMNNSEADNHTEAKHHSKPKKEEKSECKKCHSKKCEDYNKETQYCCKPSNHGKCCQGHVHDKLNCTGRGRDTAPDYCNCQHYYECHYGKLTHFGCPVGGAWTNNASAPACLKLYDPKRLCGKRRYRQKKHVPRFIEVKFIIRNSTVSPPIVHAMFSGVVPQSPLYHIMLYFKATREDFTFQTKYNPITWESIECINGKCGVPYPDMTVWDVKHNGVPFPIGEGITTYIPKDNDMIFFDFTVSTNVYG